MKNTLEMRVFFLLRRLGLLFLRNDVHEGSGNDLASEILDFAGLEFDESGGQGKESIILTTLDVLAWVELGSPLADDDVTDGNSLITENLDAEALGNRITAKGGRSTRFSGCHSFRSAYTLRKLRYTVEGVYHGYRYRSSAFMGERIRQWLEGNKERLSVLLGLFLVGGLCFEAGLLQGKMRPETPLVLSLPNAPEEGGLPAVKDGTAPSRVEQTVSHMEPVVSQSNNNDGKTDCVFVGSKNSNKYHLPTCAAAKRIKPENRVCFASKEEAEKRGYVPSCLE